MIYSTNYPIPHTFSTTGSSFIEYSIITGGQTIYRGRLYPYNNADTTLTIDIAEICSQYLETYYEDLNFTDVVYGSVPSQGLFTSIRTFTIRSENNLNSADQSYNVMYNYNTDYIYDYPDSGHLNNQIVLEVDPRQRINICGYNIGGTNTFTYSINGGTAVSFTLNSQLFQIVSIDLGSLNLVPGDRITVSQGGISYTYRVVPECRNRFILYYVNKLGGLDSLLCSGRSIQSFNPTYTDVRLYNDRRNRRDWEQKRIYSEIDKQYELNTGFLSDEDAEKIDNLIYSPKVFIHDLQKDTITSCLITNTNYTIKTFRNNRVVQYTVNVKESQKQIRR